VQGSDQRAVPAKLAIVRPKTMEARRSARYHEVIGYMADFDFDQEVPGFSRL